MAIDAADAFNGAANNIPPQLATLLEPLVNVVGPILSTLSWILGGIFGLYLILILFRVYYDHKRVKILKVIQKDVHFLREHAVVTHMDDNVHKEEKKKSSKKRSKKKGKKKR